MAETKIIYHIDEEETPYLVKIPISSEEITLLDFKQVLNKPNYKFFFKSMDQDFGWVAAVNLHPFFKKCLCRVAEMAYKIDKIWFYIHLKYRETRP